MTLVDANVLLHAYDAESPRHAPARGWLDAELSSGRPVRFALIESWLNQPNVQMLRPGARTWRLLARLCESGQAQGGLVMDAHLAALAAEHGACIATTDRDFTRFPGIAVLNPVDDGSEHQQQR